MMTELQELRNFRDRHDADTYTVRCHDEIEAVAKDRDYWKKAAAEAITRALAAESGMDSVCTDLVQCKHDRDDWKDKCRKAESELDNCKSLLNAPCDCDELIHARAELDQAGKDVIELATNLHRAEDELEQCRKELSELNNRPCLNCNAGRRAIKAEGDLAKLRRWAKVTLRVWINCYPSDVYNLHMSKSKAQECATPEARVAVPFIELTQEAEEVLNA
jgi:hypothetical protein